MEALELLVVIVIALIIIVTVVIPALAFLWLMSPGIIAIGVAVFIWNMGYPNAGVIAGILAGIIWYKIIPWPDTSGGEERKRKYIYDKDGNLKGSIEE